MCRPLRKRICYRASVPATRRVSIADTHPILLRPAKHSLISSNETSIEHRSTVRRPTSERPGLAFERTLAMEAVSSPSMGVCPPCRRDGRTRLAMPCRVFAQPGRIRKGEERAKAAGGSQRTAIRRPVIRMWRVRNSAGHWPESTEPLRPAPRVLDHQPRIRRRREDVRS